MHSPPNKTRLVCTIGPASEDPDVLRGMMEAGMDVARLNLSHGDPDYHLRLIDRIRVVSRSLGHRVAVMGDLPGPKMRIGEDSTVYSSRGAFREAAITCSPAAITMSEL